MSNKDKYFDINSMAEALKKIAQREVAEFDEPYTDREERGARTGYDPRGMQEYDIETGRPVGEEVTSGFSKPELLTFVQNARSRGLSVDNIFVFKTILKSINEEIEQRYKSKQEALPEIEDYIARLLGTQSTTEVSEPIMSPAVEDVMIGTPEEGGIEGEPEVAETPVEELDTDEGWTGGAEPQTEEERENSITDEDIDRYERQAVDSGAGMTPAEAEDEGISIVLPETMEQFGNEDISQYDISYQVGGKVMSWQNSFLQTPQAKKFLSVFGKDNLVRNPLFQKYINYTSNLIKARYPGINVSVGDIPGALYRNLINALAVQKRDKSGTEEVKDFGDNRLVLFAANPALVPAHLQAGWAEMEGLFSKDLEAKQNKAMRLNESRIKKGLEPSKVPDQLYNPVKARIISKNPTFAKQLILELNKMINRRDERLIEPILAKSEYLSAYELGHREQAGKQMKQTPTITNEEGDALTPEPGELGGEKPSDVRAPGTEALPLSSNQKSFAKTTGIMTNFVNDVWNNMSSRITDPEQYGKHDAIKLKIEMFKQQARDLAAGSGDGFLATDVGAKNNSGKVLWEKKQKKFDPTKEPKTIQVKQLVPNPATGALEERYETVEMDSRMKGIVDMKNYCRYYANLLRMKTEIQAAVGAMNMNVKNPEMISVIQSQVANRDVSFQSGALKSFLDDPKFIVMTSLQDPQKTKAEYNDFATRIADPAGENKQVKDFQGYFSIIWNKLAVDSLIAVARETNKLNKEYSHKTPEEQQRIKTDFENARQNYITMIGIRPDMIDDSKKSKWDGSSNEAKARLKTSLSTKQIMQMIAGYKRIPQNILDMVSSPQFTTANKIYNNMMIKISKLMRIRSQTIKLASSGTTIDTLIQKIITEDIRKIHKLI